MARIAAAYGRAVYGLYLLSGVVVFGIFVLIVADVFMRLIGLKPWLYASVLVEYSLLWFCMLAAPYLVRVKAHVFIDAVTRFLPEAIQRVLAKLVYTICIVTSVTFSWYALRLTIAAIAAGIIDTRAVDMPLWSLLLPVPLGFALVAVEFARFLIGIDSMFIDRFKVRDTV